MIRKKHNHTLQNNARHCGEEPQNTNKHKDKGMDQAQSPNNPMGVNIKQRILNNRTSALELTTASAIGGSNAFYWREIFAQDSVVVKTQEQFSSYGGFLMEVS